MEELRGASGVIAASMGRPIPFNNDYGGGAFRIEGRNMPSGEAIPQAERRWVTPEFFRTLGIRLEKGRLFGDFDRPEAELAAVIDNKLADRKSTRLNSSHQIISYAVFCLKKKKHLLFVNH